MRARLLRSLVVTVSLLAPVAVPALPISKQVTLNIYRVCDNAGNNCASTGPVSDQYFQSVTNTIWSQAGILVNFNAVAQINNSQYQNIDYTGGKTFNQLMQLGANYRSTTAVDVFLVNTINGAYGTGWLGLGGIAYGMDDVMSYAGGNNGLGRIDTFAHELGHNLGLLADNAPTACNDGNNGHSTNPNELMASGGGFRNVPLTAADIAPNGAGYDQINQCQINVARSSSLLRDYTPPNNEPPSTTVPEPTTTVLLAAGLAVLFTVRRRARVTA